MDINVRKIKNSPYKLVYTKDKVVGLMDYGDFISRPNFSERHAIIASKATGLVFTAGKKKVT